MEARLTVILLEYNETEWLACGKVQLGQSVDDLNGFQAHLFPDHLLKSRQSQSSGDSAKPEVDAGAATTAVTEGHEAVSRSAETNRFAPTSNGANGHGSRVDVESLLELDPTLVN